MSNRNNNQNQPHIGGSKARKSDTEFGTELTLSKKARKRAARDSKKN